MDNVLDKLQAKKDYSQWSIFFALIFVGLGFMKQGFTLQLVFLIVLVPCFLVILIVLLLRKQWKVFFIKLSIWGLAILLGLAGQYYLYYKWQLKADQIVAFIEKYKLENSQYPKKEEFYALGENNRDNPYHFYYSISEKNNQPILFYKCPNIIYATYNYDFVNERWDYQLD